MTSAWILKWCRGKSHAGAAFSAVFPLDKGWFPARSDCGTTPSDCFEGGLRLKIAGNIMMNMVVINATGEYNPMDTRQAVT